MTLLRQRNHPRLGSGGPDQALDGVIDEYGVAKEYHLAENGGDESVSIDPFGLVNRLSDAREAGFCSSYEQQVKHEVGQVAGELALDISLSMRRRKSPCSVISTRGEVCFWVAS